VKQRFFALLIHGGVERFETLKQLLKDLSVQTYSVDSCAQAKALMAQVEPQLVFTDISLSDGSWVDVVIASDKIEAPLNVIVVGASGDPALREAIVRGGAFALLSPPFDGQVVAGIVAAAAQDVRRRREIHARAAVA
jgi:DNA-binding NtrC family response regulator